MTETKAGVQRGDMSAFQTTSIPRLVGLKNNRSPIYLTDGPNNAEKRLLVKDRRFGVDWIYEVAKRIAEKIS